MYLFKKVVSGIGTNAVTETVSAFPFEMIYANEMFQGWFIKGIHHFRLIQTKSENAKGKILLELSLRIPKTLFPATIRKLKKQQQQANRDFLKRGKQGYKPIKIVADSIEGMPEYKWVKTPYGARVQKVKSIPTVKRKKKAAKKK